MIRKFPLTPHNTDRYYQGPRFEQNMRITFVYRQVSSKQGYNYTTPWLHIAKTDLFSGGGPGNKNKNYQ